MNKLKIKPYLLRLIRENILYIITDVLLLVLLITVAKIGLDKILELDNTNNSLTQEVKALQNKYNLLNTIVPSSTDLEEDIKFLDSLIPNSEDYFSIIYTLDSLSQKTNFIITSYTVDVKKSTSNKLSLSVTGIGDTAAFMNFLQNYNFEGGRLITSDRIELNPQISGAIRMDLTFYNKSVSSLNYNQDFPINAKTIEDITALKNKVNFSFKTSSDEAPLDLSYPKKSNPF